MESRDTSSSAERGLNWTRAIGIALLVALFVADHGFNVMAKSVPTWAYLLLIGMAVGMDLKDIKELLVNALTARR